MGHKAEVSPDKAKALREGAGMNDDRFILESALLSISIYAAPGCRRIATREQLAQRLDEIHGLAEKVLSAVNSDDPIIV